MTIRYTKFDLDPFDDGLDAFGGDTTVDYMPLGLLPPGAEERPTLEIVFLDADEPPAGPHGTIVGLPPLLPPGPRTQ